MRALVALALALALLLVAAASPAGAREQSPRCFPKDGSKTIAASTRVRVFYDENADGDYAYYACDLLTGRRTILAEGTFRDGDGISEVRFAGRVVAYEHSACPFTLNHDPCSTYVRTLDVHTRRARGATAQGEVTDVAVAPDGAAAWIEDGVGHPPARRVMRLGADGSSAVLDSGPGIGTDSLGLARDGHAYWLDDGTPRRERLAEPSADSRYSDPEPRGSRGCFPPRSETIAASRRIRVYLRFVKDDHITYALCDLRTGRKTKIVTVSDPEEPFSVRPVRLAGTFAAMGTRRCERYGCAPYELRVYDATRATAPLVQNAGGWVFDIALRADGAVAWIQGAEPDGYSPPSDRVLRRCARGSCETVDAARDLEPESLGLSEGSDLYWTRGGEPRSVPLGAAR